MEKDAAGTGSKKRSHEESESGDSESGEEDEDSEEAAPKKGCGGKADGATDKKPRPHVCKECDKTFSRPDNLATHMRIHTGSQPYLCKTCGKTFSDASNLAAHMKTQKAKKGCGGKEKPYACKECDKAFTQSGVLVVGNDDVANMLKQKMMEISTKRRFYNKRIFWKQRPGS
ncbi:hypothetical protein T484DRAFT_1919627 [Baffinella frigidus]|nr:hypothetical protein T484DRAFT_1919627 [Cryptophyta sp. CCMP2293]